jgi:hypothetical protein
VGVLRASGRGEERRRSGGAGDLSQSATLAPEGWVPSQPSRFAVARNVVPLTQSMPGIAVGIRAVDDFAGTPDGRRLEAWLANNDVTVKGLPGLRYNVRLIGSEGATIAAARRTPMLW